MPLIRPIQPSFGGGEYSPEIYSRVDINKYSSGLRTCRNFIIHPHGGASNRTGTRYVATAKNADKLCIVQEFIFSNEQKYIFEIGHEYIRFYTQEERLTISPEDVDAWDIGSSYSVGDYTTYGVSTTYIALRPNIAKQPDISTLDWVEQSIYEIASPYTEDDLRNLRFESSGDIVWITSPDFQTRTLTRYGATDFRLELFEPPDGPFMLENTDSISLSVSAVTGTVTLTASADTFVSEHVGALFKLRHYVEGQAVSQAFASATTSSSIRCFTTWRIITHGTWTGKFRIEKSSDGGVTWTSLRTFSSVNDFNANTSGTEDIEANPEPFLIRINVYSYTSGTANIDLTTDAFYQDGIVKVTSYSSSTHVVGTVLRDIGATTNTTSWNEGSWSDYRGWPKVARFYQDRLVFAGTATEPMTLWMSQTGDYDSFLTHSSLLDTDSISVPIPSRQLNAINGLIAFKRLLVFTSASIWSVGPVSGSAMTPTGFTTEVEEYNGSNGINPVVIGTEAIYAQEHSKIISNIGFDFTSDSFAGSITNILASHLFKKWEIIDIAYQRNPDHIVWCLRDDGKMVAMTYLREQEVVAWHQHDTLGEIESLAVIPAEGFDELWMSVSRENGRFIERMVQRFITSTCNDGSREFRLEDQFFVDCGISYGETLIKITAITMTDPKVITAPAHGFSNGQIVKIDHTDEILGLNGLSFTVGDVTTNTFSITPV